MSPEQGRLRASQPERTALAWQRSSISVLATTVAFVPILLLDFGYGQLVAIFALLMACGAVAIRWGRDRQVAVASGELQASAAVPSFVLLVAIFAIALVAAVVVWS